MMIILFYIVKAFQCSGCRIIFDTFTSTYIFSCVWDFCFILKTADFLKWWLIILFICISSLSVAIKNKDAKIWYVHARSKW